MTTIIAHRGSAGTRPENTMTSFLEAERAGADGIELDVQMTKDKELVVIHDETVNRTTNGGGWVKDFTLNQLQALDAGSWFSNKYHYEKVPQLEEVLEWMQGNHMVLNIELKSGLVPYKGIEEAVINMAKQYDMIDRVILSSFNHYSVEKAHEINPWVECAVLFMEGLYKPWEYAKKIGASALHPYWRVAVPEVISGAKKANMAIRPFTVNEEEQMANFIKLECTSIMTDYPEKALKIRETLQRRP